jgi:hypothetical protein
MDKSASRTLFAVSFMLVYCFACSATSNMNSSVIPKRGFTFNELNDNVPEKCHNTTCVS